MYRMNLADLFADPHPYFAAGMLDDLPLNVKDTLQYESNGWNAEARQADVLR